MVADGRYDIRVPSSGTLGYYVLTAAVQGGQVTYWSTVSADGAFMTTTALPFLLEHNALYLEEIDRTLKSARRTAGLCRVSVGWSPLPPVPLYLAGQDLGGAA